MSNCHDLRGVSDSNKAKVGDEEVQCFDEDFELLQDIYRELRKYSSRLHIDFE